MGSKSSQPEPKTNFWISENVIFHKSAYTKARFRKDNGKIYGHRTKRSKMEYFGRVDIEGKFYDDKEVYMGKVDKDGTVYDSNDTCIGSIGDHAMVYDNNGTLLARFNFGSNVMVAYLFFFMPT